jgi:hypothetical protein
MSYEDLFFFFLFDCRLCLERRNRKTRKREGEREMMMKEEEDDTLINIDGKLLMEDTPLVIEKLFVGASGGFQETGKGVGFCMLFFTRCVNASWLFDVLFAILCHLHHLILYPVMSFRSCRVCVYRL